MSSLDRSDIIVIIGLIFLTAGAGWIYRPMALLVPGLVLTVFGYVTAPKKRAPRETVL